MKEENYIVIQGWMRERLKLKGNELLVYAVIYGFSQAEQQRFTGSLQYLADWCGASKQGVLNNLKALLEKGLIKREERVINGVKFVEYYTTQFNGVLNKVEQGIKLSLPNNIDDNKDITHKYVGRFVPPTVEEVQAYCNERSNHINAQRFVDYYQSRGWMVGKSKMKDWRAAVRTWEGRSCNNSVPAGDGEDWSW